MADFHDAELILKLYELRTEATMREARAFVAGFNPTDAAELIALQRASGTKENAYWRQATSYWEMAAAFVLHDALDADLFIASNGENIFYYAKFTPFFEEYAKAFGIPFMRQTAALIEKYPQAQERYTVALARMAAAKKQKTD